MSIKYHVVAFLAFVVMLLNMQSFLSRGQFAIAAIVLLAGSLLTRTILRVDTQKNLEALSSVEKFWGAIVFPTVAVVGAVSLSSIVILASLTL